MSERDPGYQPEQSEAGEQILSATELRMMNWVANRTGAPAEVRDGQAGEAWYAVEHTHDQLSQANQVRVAYWDEDEGNGTLIRHSSVTFKLVLPKGALAHADWASDPSIGLDLYKLQHNFDATSRTGYFWLSAGDVEMDTLTDESFVDSLLDDLGGAEATGRIQAEQPSH